MNVVVRGSDICTVELTKHGNEIYDKFCAKMHNHYKEAGWWWFGQCPEPDLTVPLYWLMRIFGKHLHSFIHDDSSNQPVFVDGIHFR